MVGVDSLFNSGSFVVFGATNKPEKPGYIIFKNLIENKIKVAGVNITGGEVFGKKLYRDLGEVPHNIDCAIIATPAKTTPLILRQVAKRKIQNVVIISSGFAEAGNKKFEEHISHLAKQLNLNVQGPNCFGFINPYKKTNTTFYSGNITPGETAFISQSGAIGAGIIDKLKSFSGFVSVGNAADLKITDYIEYFSNDKNTKVITLYLESLEEGEGKRFLEVTSKSKKPILVLKAGKSEKGKKASRTHTASLASAQEIYSGAFKKSGVIECNSIEELFSLAGVLEKYPKIEDKNLIITNAGGLGVLTSDYLEKDNLKIPTLTKKLKDNLTKILPENWSHNNPVDIGGDADFERLLKTLRLTEKENFFDNYIVLLTPQHMINLEKSAKLLALLKKPVFVCILGGDSTEKAKSILIENKIPISDEPSKISKIISLAKKF